MITKMIRTLFLGVLALVAAGQAQALILSPGGEYTSETFFPAYNNPDAADVSAITGTSVDLLYKNNVGGAEEGLANFIASYEAIYFNTETDPSDAQIRYVGGDIMTDASWLIVKDGNQNPSWYLFDISSWDGVEDLWLTGFWPAQGAISHVSFFGGSTSVPEPSTLALLGLGLVGLSFARKGKKSA